MESHTKDVVFVGCAVIALDFPGQTVFSVIDPPGFCLFVFMGNEVAVGIKGEGFGFAVFKNFLGEAAQGIGFECGDPVQGVDALDELACGVIGVFSFVAPKVDFMGDAAGMALLACPP